jgi:hypothetical protein
MENSASCPGCGTALSEHQQLLTEFRCPSCRRWKYDSGLISLPVAGPPGTPPEVIRVHAPSWEPVDPGQPEKKGNPGWPRHRDWREQQEIAEAWERARDAGTRKKDFASDRKTSLKDLNRLLNRVRKRKSRTRKKRGAK